MLRLALVLGAFGCLALSALAAREERSLGRDGALERARLEQGLILAEKTVLMMGELQEELAQPEPQPELQRRAAE